MKTLLFVFLIIVLFVASKNVGAEATSLSNVKNFALALGIDDISGQISALDKYDLVVLDAENTLKEDIAALRAKGVIVLGYLSVGTIEKNRSWYKRAKKYRLDYWGDWGEWYANVSRRGFRDLITKRVAPRVLKKHFDGLFLDNVDMIETHRRQKAGMKRLVVQLSRLVHKKKRFLFAQNGQAVMGSFLKHLDGWNREDVTSTYDFERKEYYRLTNVEIEKNMQVLRHIRSQGLLVTATDYAAEEDSETLELARSNACSAGAVPFVTDIMLKRLPTVPVECFMRQPG